MKGFIEVHCDTLPILININRISGVQDNEYCRRYYECTICLGSGILCKGESKVNIIPDESYDLVKRMIEEAMV